MWEVATRRILYEKLTDKEMKDTVMNGRQPGIPHIADCDAVKGCPEEYEILMRQCWNHESVNRPDFPTVAESLNKFVESLSKAIRQSSTIL